MDVSNGTGKKDTALALTLAALLIGSIFVGAFSMTQYVSAQEAETSSESNSTNSAESESSSSEVPSASSNSSSSDTSSSENTNSTTGSESSTQETSSEASDESSTTSTETSNNSTATTVVNATESSVEESAPTNSTTSTEATGTDSQENSTVIAMPELSSEKNEYRPGEVAHIQGVNFMPSTSYDVYVFRGDGWLVKSNGEDGYDTINTDESGSFDYSYEIPSVNGEWLALVYESTDIDLNNLAGRIIFSVEAPTLSTDKFDYDPSEVVTVFGKGFTADESYDIVIERPDGSVIKGDGTFTEGFDEVSADSGGEFTYSYILNGIPGAYQIYAYRSSDDSHLELIARGGFADANTGPLYGGTAASSTWTATGNAVGAADDFCATSSANNAFIDVTNFGFTSGMIPPGSTITAITVEVDLLGSIGGGDRKVDIQLLKGGSPVGAFINDLEATKAVCNAPPIADFVTLTSPTNSTWGAKFNQADVISSGFGVRIKQDSGSGMRSLDSVRITITYAESNTGKISGLKFNDLNGNGIKDGGEPTLSGWTINLHNSATNAIITSVATNASGLYQFSSLAAGTYEVTETLQSGWIQTKPLSPSNYTIVVTGTTNSQNNDFGNFKLGEISGIKYDDSNGNGSQDLGESTLSGWNITLTGPINDSVLTDGDGKYKFISLTNGTYTVSEILQSGWIQTSTPTSYSIDITSDANSTNNDFGNFRLVTISGQKFEDNNGDGIKNGADAGLAGWHMQLLNATDDSQIGGDAITDVNGDYNFTNIGPGSYKVVEVQQSGWTMTFPANGTYLITTSSGQNVTGKDFGNFENIAISGMKFEDHDGNGTKDGIDQGLAGWTINLFNVSSNVVIASDVTSGGGIYEFNDLPPGEYAVREVLQTGWIQTTVNPSNITASSGVNSTGNDFGNFKLGEISGIKYDDKNGNGFHDGGEPTIAGWNITLTGPINNSTLTDSNGQYEFTGLTNGTYTVSEELQSGWIQTSTPTSYEIDISSGVNATANDFGNFRLISITGMKFNDTNGSNSKDPTESGLSGWTIRLYNATSSTLITSTVTNNTGHYAFEGLGPGQYAIREVNQLGWVQTTPNPSNITAVSGQNVTNVNFGNFRLPVSQVTSSSLGVTGFDMDPSEPDQDFRLILTHDPKNPVAYKLTASNPGQTYYNVFYIGTPGTDFAVTMKIPYPYVTQGSQPIQLHDGVSIVSGSYVPGPTVPSTISGSKPGGGPITTATPSGALGIAIGDYGTSPALGDTQVTIVVSGEIPSSGIAYVTIHLDYGLKGTGNYGKGSSNNVVIYSTTTVVIPHHADHNFNAVTPTNSSSPIVYNINIFKHDPGFVGVVTSTSSGETIKGAKIQVYTSAGKIVGTAYTDENGYYQYYYKYTGKSTTFIVKLVDYSKQQSVALKSNGFALAYFQIP